MRHAGIEAYEARTNLADMLDDGITEKAVTDENGNEVCDAETDLATMLGDNRAKNCVPEEAKEDSYTEIKCVDAVSAVSVYNQLRKKHDKKIHLKCKYEKSSVEQLLFDYHSCCENDDTKKWLRDEIFFRIYFLIPHAVKKGYRIASHTFNDAMQNMSFTVLQAIETFDPTKNFKFVNYLVGYFKSAISKTFRDTNVVSVPTGRRKILKEMQQSIKTESLGDTEEILSYTGVEYMENGTAGMPNFDFDEDLHNKQLIEWLEEALSSEANVVTSDERRVLVLHYGLFGHERLPYHDIAKLRAAEGRGCAYSRLSQIHTKAIKKLQKYFSDRNIGEY